MANDSLDLGLKVRLPTTGKPHDERYRDKLVLHEPWYHGTALGLVVPAYVDVDTIPELGEHFAYRNHLAIVGMDSGASIMDITEDVIVAYELDMELLDSSDAARMGALDDTYRREAPIEVTLWSPHWALAACDLKYLEDPRGMYGENEDIYWIRTRSSVEWHPEVVRWMNAWHMDDAQIGSLIQAINDAEREIDDALDDAREWIDNNNQEVAQSWF